MDQGLPFLFFFSSLGVFNGLLMGVYFLLIAKPKRIQNQFFGLLLLMLTLRIGKSVLFYFERDLSKVVLQIGLSGCLFVGPFLFFYIRSVLNQQKGIRRKELWHLLSWFILIVAIGFIFPYTKRPDLWNPEIVQGIYAVWVAYVIAAAYLIRNLFRILFLKPRDLSLVHKWLLIVFATNALICLVFNSILYFGFPSYIFGPITFSFVFYILLAFLLFFPNSKTIIEGEKQRYVNKKIDTSQTKQMGSKLQQLMIQKRLFENVDLKLKDIADELQITPHLLSQFLNDNLQKSFADFVNEYRIKAASELLRQDHNLTMEGVGQEVGFRSKSSFYATFKKIHGVTPNQFAKRVRAV